MWLQLVVGWSQKPLSERVLLSFPLHVEHSQPHHVLNLHVVKELIPKHDLLLDENNDQQERHQSSGKKMSVMYLENELPGEAEKYI